MLSLDTGYSSNELNKSHLSRGGWKEAPVGEIKERHEMKKI